MDKLKAIAVRDHLTRLRGIAGQCERRPEVGVTLSADDWARIRAAVGHMRDVVAGAAGIPCDVEDVSVYVPDERDLLDVVDYIARPF